MIISFDEYKSFKKAIDFIIIFTKKYIFLKVSEINHFRNGLQLVALNQVITLQVREKCIAPVQRFSTGTS